MSSLPAYLSQAKATPASARAPWYKNTAPSYAGVFLWIAFYNAIAVGTISHGSMAVCLAALAVAGAVSYLLFYWAPATMGMKTGYPLYVIGASTFGARGGYVMPGLLMGALQVGWLGVGTFFATKFILTAAGVDPRPGTMPFVVTGAVWGYVMAFIGVLGIQYVARVATYLSLIPLAMILFMFSKAAPGVGGHVASEPDGFVAFTMLVQIVVGFFATAGAAGADFGSNSRNEGDVRWGGIVGIVAAILVAGGLPLMTVAGARVLMPGSVGFNYDTVVGAMGGPMAGAMFVLFAVASIPPACFSSFIAGNSFATMIPGVSRMGSTMAGMTVAIVLAVTGVAENLVGFFTIVGASFGPICGAMAADYLKSGKVWPGPRDGVNVAGYGAWAAGFVVGILPFLPVPGEVKRLAQPAVVYSFVVGFVAYWGLAAAGLESKKVKMGQ